MEETKADAGLVGRTIALMLEHDQVVIPARMRVGMHVFEQYFAADEALVRSKEPKKAMSYAKLCEDALDDTSWSAATIREAVVVAATARSLRAPVANEMKWSLLWLLYQVDDLGVRRALAERIYRGTLHGRAAREAILREARKRTRGGRPPQPGVTRAFGNITRILDRSRASRAFDRAKLRALGPEGARAAVTAGEEAAATILAVVSDIKKEFDI